MADYYVIRQDDRNETISVVIHIPVPGGDNDALPTPRSWQSVVAELRTFSGETGSAVPWADAPMIAALDAGTLYEHHYSFQDNSDNVAALTPAERAANLDAAVTAEIARFQADFAAIYRFYGTERTVT